MSAVWQAKGLVLLFVLLSAGCGSGDAGAPGPSPEALVQSVASPPAVVLGGQEVPATSTPGVAGAPTASPPPNRPDGAALPFVLPATPDASPSPTAGATATQSPSPGSTAGATANPLAISDASAVSTPRESLELLRASQNSPFHEFGDGVHTWDDDRRIVVLAVPAGHPSLEAIRSVRGHWDGTIEDTPGTRAWVQQCARRHADDALGAPDAVYGAVSAQAVHACLGGLAHLAELFARYWWTEAGVGCLSDAVTAHSLHGDNRPRPLAVCPSIGYDPAAPRPSGWLAQRCAEIVAANPNPGYPDNPAQPGEPLPSCWEPLLAIIEAHAGEGVEIGLPDRPHDCYHAFLGYVWARQTDRESRPPSDLAIGCHYRAFEAIP